jgi:hypothetical protein
LDSAPKRTSGLMFTFIRRTRSLTMSSFHHDQSLGGPSQM